MDTTSERHDFSIFNLFTTTILLVFFIISFLAINLHFKVNISRSINNTTARNVSCDHNVYVYNSDGTKNVVQRCYPLLINCGHRCCQQAQQRNCLTGLANGVRQCVKLNMTIFDNDQRFAKKNKHILDRKRGAGYWLWKPYIIHRELYLAREGDIIVYSDAAVDVIQNIDHLINLTRFHDVITFEQNRQVDVCLIYKRKNKH
jgi:hypothetical protein